jgi:hypothetical protein
MLKVYDGTYLDDKEVGLDIYRSENEIFPTVGQDHSSPCFESVSIDSVGRVESVQEEVLSVFQEKLSGSRSANL